MIFKNIFIALLFFNLIDMRRIKKYVYLYAKKYRKNQERTPAYRYSAGICRLTLGG
jgi:hypothetical protein